MYGYNSIQLKINTEKSPKCRYIENKSKYKTVGIIKIQNWIYNLFKRNKYVLYWKFIVTSKAVLIGKFIALNIFIIIEKLKLNILCTLKK